MSYLKNQFAYLRHLILFLIYFLIGYVSLYLAYEARFDFSLDSSFAMQRSDVWWWIVLLKISMLLAFRQFGGFLTYFSFPDLYRILFSCLSVAVFLIVVWWLNGGRGVPPRGVIVTDLVTTFLLLCAFRSGMRVVRERYFTTNTEGDHYSRVAILGAGSTGAALGADLLSSRGYGMVPYVYLDDDKSKVGLHVHGIDVVGGTKLIPSLKEDYKIDKVIIAMPSAPAQRIKELSTMCQRHDLPLEILPSLAELTTGKVKASKIRPIEFQDLLGRDPAELDSDKIKNLIHDRVVMVTGGGGSIGSELCRQIVSYDPKRLLIVEQSEGALFETEQRLIDEGFSGVIKPLVADVLDSIRMGAIFALNQPEIIFHAAAHKHVFLMERQPGEALKNNSLATLELARLASRYEVERFVFISTDKAINPTSVMGASKRLAELQLQAVQTNPENKTKFMAVRFGNVLGSSGSVIPIFKKQIAAGGPIKVTHPEVTRYFMTIPEAVGLVLQASTQGLGSGEIFVLDMGEPVRIVDVARQLIELSGLKPDVDIAIEYIGLRPGEKLYEELQHDTEEYEKTEHPGIMKFVVRGGAMLQTHAQAIEAMDQLQQAFNTSSSNDLKRLIQSYVPEYTPYWE